MSGVIGGVAMTDALAVGAVGCKPVFGFEDNDMVLSDRSMSVAILIVCSRCLTAINRVMWLSCLLYGDIVIWRYGDNDNGVGQRILDKMQEQLAEGRLEVE